jgi:hypothetical protein
LIRIQRRFGASDQLCHGQFMGKCLSSPLLVKAGSYLGDPVLLLVGLWRDRTYRSWREWPDHSSALIQVACQVTCDRSGHFRTPLASDDLANSVRDDSSLKQAVALLSL